MRKRVRFPQVGLLILVFASFVQSVSAHEPTYTLVDAFRDALANDARLALVEIQMDAQLEQKNQAESQLGMQANLSGMAGWQRYSVQGVNRSTEQNTSNETITVTQPLYSPRQRELLEQSLIKIDYAKLNLNNKRVELAMRVVEGYLNALMAQESYQLSKFQSETAIKNLNQVEEALKLGYSSKVDLFSAKSEVDNAKARELADALAMQTQRHGLEQMVGRKLPERLPMLHVAEEQWVASFLANKDWLSIAKSDSLELSLSEKAVDIARRELEVRKAESKPVVQAGLQYGQIQGGSSYTAGENQYLYAQVSMPLYDSGYNDSRRREATVLIRASEQEMRIKTLEIEKRVQELRAGLESSKEQLSALRQAISSGEVYLELSEESYRLGLRNLLEVQRAKEKLHANQRDFLKASMMMVNYLCQLYAVSAKLDEAWLGTLSGVLWTNRTN